VRQPSAPRQPATAIYLAVVLTGVSINEREAQKGLLGRYPRARARRCNGAMGTARAGFTMNGRNPRGLPFLGPCCTCGTTEGVTNIATLDRRGPIPGRGWGCVVCGLPPDGAVAVLCNNCFGLPTRFACRGYPASDGRIAIANLPKERFAHDPDRHRTLH
jgi:hypothetical protein